MKAAKVGKSKRSRSTIVALMSFAALLVLVGTNPTLVQRRPTVTVRLEAENHVCVQSVGKKHIFLPIRLTYQIGPTDESRCVKIPMVPLLAGLVVEHIGDDGTRSTQSVPPVASWQSHPETVELRSSTLPVEASIWISLGSHFDFSRPGLYRLSYAHPWADSPKDPNKPFFQSNVLTVTCVSLQRHDQLSMMLLKNPELALASYKFKNPPVARETAKQRRAVAKILDEAIEEGAPYDKVLFLLGSPGILANTTEGRRKTFGWDQEWFYETNPVGGYAVMFKNGCVFKKFRPTDWNGIRLRGKQDSSGDSFEKSG